MIQSSWIFTLSEPKKLLAIWPLASSTAVSQVSIGPLLTRTALIDLAELPYSRATVRPTKWVLVVPEDSPVQIGAGSGRETHCY